MFLFVLYFIFFTHLEILGGSQFECATYFTYWKKLVIFRGVPVKKKPPCILNKQPLIIDNSIIRCASIFALIIVTHSLTHWLTDIPKLEIGHFSCLTALSPSVLYSTHVNIMSGQSGHSDQTRVRPDQTTVWPDRTRLESDQTTVRPESDQTRPNQSRTRPELDQTRPESDQTGVGPDQTRPHWIIFSCSVVPVQ